LSLAALVGLRALTLVSGFPKHEIIDVEADIRDLDVGDLDDMESDVPPSFLEELKRGKQKKAPPIDMNDPASIMAGSQGGTQMSFATLTQEKAEELGKGGTEQLASTWKTMLETGGVDAQCYAVDPGKILFVTNGPGSVEKIKGFVLSQSDVDWFEINQQRHYPRGRAAPLMDNEARAEREAELGWRAPPEAAPAAEKQKKKRKKG